MKEKLKRTILLTIQDLKDLGLIGRKKKSRRKKRRVINKINSQNQTILPDNPYFKSQTFTNSNNLDTENKRLQNEALSNEVSIRNSGLSNPTNIVQNKAIEDLRQNHEDFRNATINYLTNRFHNDNQGSIQQPRLQHQNTHITFADNESSQLNTEPDDNSSLYVDEEDGIDVPTQDGSDHMISEGSSIPDVQSDGASVLSWDMNYDPTAKVKPTGGQYSFWGSSPKIVPENNIIDDNHTVQSNLTNEFFTPKTQSKPLSKIDQLYIDASDLGIDRNEFTPNVVAMRALIAKQKIINPLQDKYVDLGGGDERVFNGGVMELKKHITILELQQEYLGLGGSNQNIINSFDKEKIRRAIKVIKNNKYGLDSLINSQPNKINDYYKK